MLWIPVEPPNEVGVGDIFLLHADIVQHLLTLEVLADDYLVRRFHSHFR